MARWKARVEFLLSVIELLFLSLTVEAPESSTQTASRSVQPFLQGSLVWQIDRQTERPTDRPTYHANNRPQLRTYVVLRCGLKITASMHCTTCVRRWQKSRTAAGKSPQLRSVKVISNIVRCCILFQHVSIITVQTSVHPNNVHKTTLNNKLDESRQRWKLYWSTKSDLDVN